MYVCTHAFNQINSFQILPCLPPLSTLTKIFSFSFMSIPILPPPSSQTYTHSSISFLSFGFSLFLLFICACLVCLHVHDESKPKNNKEGCVKPLQTHLPPPPPNKNKLRRKRIRERKEQGPEYFAYKSPERPWPSFPFGPLPF